MALYVFTLPLCREDPAKPTKRAVAYECEARLSAPVLIPKLTNKGGTLKKQHLMKHLSVWLSADTDKHIESGVAAMRALGVTAIRTRSDFVRYAVEQKAQDAMRRVIELGTSLAEAT